jgi:hypothetical protein
LVVSLFENAHQNQTPRKNTPTGYVIVVSSSFFFAAAVALVSGLEPEKERKICERASGSIGRWVGTLCWFQFESQPASLELLRRGEPCEAVMKLESLRQCGRRFS